MPPWTRRWIFDGRGRVAWSAQAWRRLECRPAEEPGSPGLEGWIRSLRHGPFGLLSYRIPNAVDLDGGQLEAACFRLYLHMAEKLRASATPHPIRLWNHIPRILDPLGGLEHRYMVFNAGRLRAMRRWLGREELSRQVATASGVGHFGRDLVIHCLASEAPGAPVENPRQVPAYRYSARYGPEPPCFARATRLERSGSPPWLLVGGTASVRGEDSQHLGDLEAQLAETLVNLAEVSRVGRGCVARRGPTQAGTAEARLDTRERSSAGEGELAAFRQLRVYHVDRAHRRRIRAYLKRHLPAGAEVEYWHADLCRPELLVEIEGLAELGPPAELEV